MRTRLSLPRNFSFDAVVRSHGWYDLPPYSYDAEQGTLTTVGAGAAVWTFRARDGHLEIAGSGGSAPSVRAMARRIFSLDVELSAFDAALIDEPALKRALARGGGRMLRAPTLFEDAVKMLLTTNCSWATTRGMVQRLVALTPDGSFPGPEALARVRPGALGSKVRCGYRARALSRFARRIASGSLDLSAWERRATPAADVREAILAEHGFGPYAAEGLLRVLGRHEYLALDSWLRKQYRRLYPGPAKTADGAIVRRYARFGDYKGLALWLDMTREWHEGRLGVGP